MCVCDVFCLRAGYSVYQTRIRLCPAFPVEIIQQTDRRAFIVNLRSITFFDEDKFTIHLLAGIYKTVPHDFTMCFALLSFNKQVYSVIESTYI